MLIQTLFERFRRLPLLPSSPLVDSLELSLSVLPLSSKFEVPNPFLPPNPLSSTLPIQLDSSRQASKLFLHFRSKPPPSL